MLLPTCAASLLCPLAGVDFIALSFVKSADPIKNLKSYVESRASRRIDIVAKVGCLPWIEAQTLPCISVPTGTDVGTPLQLSPAGSAASVSAPLLPFPLLLPVCNQPLLHQFVFLV